MVNVKPIQLGKTTRMSFSKINEVIDMPNLIGIQKDSYEWFLQDGIKEVFRDVSPITDANGKYELSFISHRFDDKIKYTIEECKERDATYAVPIRVTARLLNKETGSVIDNEIYMGDLPLMTDSGTFVINGSERVVVSQLVRSPGVYYGFEHDKTGKKLFKATVIPNRGAWLEYEMDANDVFYVRIDKNRKIPVTTFLRSIGLSTNAELTGKFGDDPRITCTIEKDSTQNKEEALLEVYKKLHPGDMASVESAQNQLNMLFFDAKRYDLSRFGRYKYNKKLAISERIYGKKAAEAVIAPLTGEILVDEGEVITKEKALEIENAGVIDVTVVHPTREGATVKVCGNGMVDIKTYTGDMDVESLGINEHVRFAVLRDILEEAAGDQDTLRILIKARAEELIPKHITIEDIFATVSYFIDLCEDVGNVDDIDHLGNRRIRCVGELLQNQFRIGFTRMERTIREKMALSGQDQEKVTPDSFVNCRQVISAMREFFGSSPLSQFMDQNNPLAELTHKRRLSSLGPGGLSRDRAGFEVRDVHYSHYGRMCPIETPEGPNIGLISYLATFARINVYGFIEAPYRRVDKATGKVLDEVVYMTADVEDNYVVAQANEPLDEEGRFARPRVNARCRDSILEIEREKVDFMDVSPKMVVSVATAMIPFLENDANRALMGANMQRQAVPLMVTDNPIVGTGMEYKAAVDSGIVVCTKEDGVVTEVDADKIVVTNDLGQERIYRLIKFKRSNQGNCVNQRPIVSKGERVKAGDVIADGPATKMGEIALGKNALIGFMTWEGYNYEDAVLINEKLVYNDVYTSIHIEEYELECRDTKLGAEEITRDIPNLSDDALKDLDERGIVRIGAEVHSGDILVGKVSPKGETELNAEERLLRAIFGEKAREVRDNSLRVAHGVSGIVVDVKVFDRTNCDELSPGVNEKVRVYIAQKRKISVGDKMAGRHGNKGVVSRILRQEDMPFLPDGTPLDIVLNPLGVPSRMNIGQVLEVHLGYVAKALGWKIATPVFDGAHEQDIRELYDAARSINNGKVTEEADRIFNMGKADGDRKEPELLGLNSAGLDFTKLPLTSDCKTQLTDGRTGEKFDGPVTVGYMYYLKLHHLVDDKIHARSTGPYSLVTQQPLGGKAQFGGQRFGEMEVWALEAYGAAYTLQEILTVKSDDLIGRQKTYEAIVKGEPVPKPGVPESFKVMIRELQGLGLDVRVLDENGEVVDLRNDGDEDEDDNRYPAETFEMNYSNDDAELEKSGYGIIDEEDLKENGSDDDDFSDDGFSDGEPIDFGEDE